jgi:hypothetical protein
MSYKLRWREYKVSISPTNRYFIKRLGMGAVCGWLGYLEPRPVATSYIISRKKNWQCGIQR